MIEKFYISFCVCILTMGMLTGCRTPAPSWNFTLPDGFLMTSRETSDVNLYFTLHGDKDLTQSRIAEMHESIEHYFRKSKRFAIYWQQHPAVREDVVINAHFEIMSHVGAAESAMGAKVTLSAMCNLHNGMAGESLLVTGFSSPDMAKNSFIAPVNFSVSKHFTMALHDALNKLQRNIDKLYPISSLVENFRYIENGGIKMIIPIGTGFGLSSEYEYLVCYKQGNEYFVLGLADGIPGADVTQLQMFAFNTSDPDFNSVYMRMQHNDKTLCENENLFVVARRKR